MTRRIGLAIVALALIAGGTKAVGAFLAPRAVKVPSLSGLSKQRAGNRAEALGLKIDVVGRRSDPAVAAGAVVSQRPASGILKEGSVVRVVLSSGPPRWDVPSVEGATLEAATVMIRSDKFEIGGVEREFSTAPEGVVIEQSPAEGKLAWGGKIALVVSKGPQAVTVPSVAGLTPDKAKAALHDAGFEVSITTGYSGSVDEGLVVATAPAAGAAAPQGSTVQVVVSAGPRYKNVTMPDVRNMTVDAATARLESMGLLVQVVQSCGGGSTVVETDPVAGTTVKQHDTIALFVC